MLEDALEFMEIASPYIIFILGAYMGSFAYTIILRWPAGKPFLFCWSQCPHCQIDIAGYDNIPLISWLFLKGRCRSCEYKIGCEYFLIEIFMALLFLSLYWHIGLKWILAEYAFLLFGLTAITIIDLKSFLIPDILSLTGIVLGLLGAALNPERSFLDSFVGLIVGGGFFWAMASVYYSLRKIEGLGGGDIKLLAWIGTVLGIKSIPFVILVSSMFGILAGCFFMGSTKQGLKTEIPYGPFLALSGAIYIFGGDQWFINHILVWFFPF